METTLIFMYVCVGIDCIGIGFGSIAVGIAALRGEGLLVRQKFNTVHHPNAMVPGDRSVTIQYSRPESMD